MCDFASVFIGSSNVGKYRIAESELRFYLSMGSKMYGFAWVFIGLRSKMYDFAYVFNVGKS